MGKICSKTQQNLLQQRLTSEKFHFIQWSPKQQIHLSIVQQTLYVIQLPGKITQANQLIDRIIFNNKSTKQNLITEQTIQIRNALLFNFSKRFLLIQIYFKQASDSSKIPIDDNQQINQLTRIIQETCKKLFEKFKLKNLTGLTLWQLNEKSQKYLNELATCKNKYPELHDQNKRNLVYSVIVYKKALQRLKNGPSSLNQLYNNSVKKLAGHQLRIITPTSKNIEINNIELYPQEYFGNQLIIKQVQKLLKKNRISTQNKIVFTYFNDKINNIKLFKKQPNYIYCNMYYGKRLDDEIKSIYDPVINIEVDFFDDFNILNQQEVIAQFSKLIKIQREQKKKEKQPGPKKQKPSDLIKKKTYRICIQNNSKQFQTVYLKLFKKIQMVHDIKYLFVYEVDSPDFYITLDKQNMMLTGISQSITFFNKKLTDNINIQSLLQLLVAFEQFKKSKKYQIYSENKQNNSPTKKQKSKLSKQLNENLLKNQQQKISPNKITPINETKKKTYKQPIKIIFDYQIKCFPVQLKQVDIIKSQISKIAEIQNNSEKKLSLIILKNMHDRGGLDLFDSQINYKFQQFRQILTHGPALIINLSPKCYLVSKVLQQNIVKRMKLFQYEVGKISQNVQFIACQYNILDRKINFNQKSKEQFTIKIKKFINSV